MKKEEYSQLPKWVQQGLPWNSCCMTNLQVASQEKIKKALVSCGSNCHLNDTCNWFSSPFPSPQSSQKRNTTGWTFAGEGFIDLPLQKTLIFTLQLMLMETVKSIPTLPRHLSLKQTGRAVHTCSDFSINKYCPLKGHIVHRLSLNFIFVIFFINCNCLDTLYSCRMLQRIRKNIFNLP